MRTSWLPALALAFLLSACEEEDAASVRVKLRPGGAGEIHTSCLVQLAEAGPVEARLAGSTARARVGLVASSGAFADIARLGVADISFRAGASDSGLRWLEVTVPQGPDAQWPRLFVPMDDAARLDAVAALGGGEEAKQVGSALKLEIELPASVVSQGLAGEKVRGARGKSEGTTATLMVPVERALKAAAPLSWQITWSE